MLAMLVAGYMAKRRGGVAGPAQSGGGLGEVLGGLLDLNGDGNPLDDILGMAGKMMR